MLVVQMLLPRFLVLEVVLFIHFVHEGHGCLSRSKAKKSNNQDNSIEEGEEEKNCHIDLHSSELRWPPLFLHPSSGSFVMPHNDEAISSSYIQVSEELVAACPGARLDTLGDGSSGQTNLDCLGDGQLVQVDTDFLPLVVSSLSCSRSIRETLVETGVACGPFNGSSQTVHVGWSVSGSFSVQYSVCHDKTREHTYFTNHTLIGSALNARDRDSSRPSFKEGGRGFYSSTSANKAYTMKGQRQNLPGNLGSLEGDFLAKGHLAPDADFIYGEWQDATYYYVNAAPQWQAFNNGNWKAVESAVRRLAEGKKRSFSVYTGTHGNLEHEGQPLALGHSGQIQVPLFFWKLVHDPVENEAVAFVGVNKPYLSLEENTDDDLVPARLHLCPYDGMLMCEAALWTQDRSWKRPEKGLVYCCSYSGLKRTLPWIVDLPRPPSLLQNTL